MHWEKRAVELVSGNSLLHTDLHALNILVGESARVIDWAWSRRGAIWVDTAFLVIRLIAAGHEPDEAEKWADAVPPWHDASDSARTAFAVAVYGIWAWLGRKSPLPHRPKLTAVARTWARCRLRTGS